MCGVWRKVFKERVVRKSVLDSCHQFFLSGFETLAPHKSLWVQRYLTVVLTSPQFLWKHCGTNHTIVNILTIFYIWLQFFVANLFHMSRNWWTKYSARWVKTRTDETAARWVELLLTHSKQFTSNQLSDPKCNNEILVWNLLRERQHSAAKCGKISTLLWKRWLPNPTTILKI